PVKASQVYLKEAEDYPEMRTHGMYQGAMVLHVWCWSNRDRPDIIAMARERLYAAEPVVAADPGASDMAIHLGYALAFNDAMSGFDESAINRLLVMLAKDPASTHREEAFSWLRYCLGGRVHDLIPAGRVDDLLALVDRVAALYPQVTWFSRDQVLLEVYRLGRYSDALTQAEKLVDSPDSNYARDALVYATRCCIQLGLEDDAKVWLSRFEAKYYYLTGLVLDLRAQVAAMAGSAGVQMSVPKDGAKSVRYDEVAGGFAAPKGFTGPGHGTLDYAPPYLTYTAAPGYSGLDSFIIEDVNGRGRTVVVNVYTPALELGRVELHAGQYGTIDVLAGSGLSVDPNVGMIVTVERSAGAPPLLNPQVVGLAIPDGWSLGLIGGTDPWAWQLLRTGATGVPATPGGGSRIVARLGFTVSPDARGWTSYTLRLVTAWDTVGGQTRNLGSEDLLPGRVYVWGGLRGDANGDGALSISDVVLALRLYVLGVGGAGPVSAGACDVNGDGHVGLGDLVLLCRCIMLNEPLPPLP
ncbi:MAG TPA: hypothetical protein VGN26_08240, partial [Armatimonadota bacterium]